MGLRVALVLLAGTPFTSSFIPWNPPACPTNLAPGTTTSSRPRTSGLWPSASFRPGGALRSMVEDSPTEKQSGSIFSHPPHEGGFILMEGLPYSATEADVRSLFDGMTVNSVYLPMASQQRNGQTKGVAVVGFSSEEEADEAVKKHGEQVQGRWVSIERCMSPYQTRMIKIRGVPFSMGTEDLSMLFEEFGPVEFAQVSHDRNGIGYVLFAEHKAAVAALSRDGAVVGNRWLDIVLFPKQLRTGGRKKQGDEGAEGGAGGARRRNRLRLAGLPFEWTLEDVEQHLKEKGLDASEVYLPSFKQDPNKNVGVAYLTINDDDMYQKALEMGDWELNGRMVTVQQARDRPPPSRRPGDGQGAEASGGGGGYNRQSATLWSNRVYFGNLPYGMTADDIEQFLAAQSVNGVTRIITPQNKIGIAYITFDSAEMAERAAKLDGATVSKDGRERYLRANVMTNNSQQGRPREEGGRDFE